MKKKDLFFIVLGSIFFAFVMARVFPENAIVQSIISPLADKFGETSPSSTTNSEELSNIVGAVLDGKQGVYAVVIKNLRTGETYMRNENRKFTSASLYKLWVAGAAYDLIEKEELDENQTITRNIPELNRLFDIEEAEAEQTQGTITRTVSRAIDDMITISANYPALLLSAEIGNSRISSYMRGLGLTNSALGQPPTTTAGNIAKFYELLYDGKIVNQEYSAKFIDILTKQQLNDRIPKYLPEDIRVAHKTGELEAFKHDAGIIFGKDAILFVVLSETNSQTTAAENTALLAQYVFNYFENN